VRRLRGDDHMARAHVAAVVVHHQVDAIRPDGPHAAARAGALPELAAQRRRQLAGPTQQVAGDQRALAAPHEREQPDPTAGRELVQLGRGAVRGAREDLLRRGWERAEELTEGAVVLEVVAVLEPVVAGDGALDLEARLGECDPVARRKR
jgi:hypothetical protein